MIHDYTDEVPLYREYLKNIITYTYLASKPKTMNYINLDTDPSSVSSALTLLLIYDQLPVSIDQVCVILDNEVFNSPILRNTQMSDAALIIFLSSEYSSDINYYLPELSEDCKLISIRV